ncbi:RWP-RK domain [Pycnococcus provasolii]
MPAFFSSSLALIMDPDDVSDFSGGFSGVSSEGTTDSNNKVLLTTTAAAAAAAAEATTTSSGQMGKLMQDEDDVTAIFRMPLSQACERLGATKEALKKQARSHGLSRWPSRRLLSVARVAKSLADYMDYLEETNADEKTKELVAQASMCVACEYKETQRNSKNGVARRKDPPISTTTTPRRTARRAAAAAIDRSDASMIGQGGRTDRLLATLVVCAPVPVGHEK